jgi:hypothetical protein
MPASLALKAKGLATKSTKRHEKAFGVSLCAFCGYQMLAEELTMYGSLEMSFAIGK